MKSLKDGAVVKVVAGRPGCSIFYISDQLDAKSRRDMDRVSKKLRDEVAAGSIRCDSDSWGNHYTVSS